MPREKKQRLKKRADGRYACRYKGQWFYSFDQDDCLQQREDYKKAEKQGRIMPYFLQEYALRWLDRTYPDVAPSTLGGYRRHVQKLINVIGDLPVSQVKPSDLKEVYTHEYRKLSNSYIKSARQIYCSLFDSAVADGLILSNPARDRTAKPHTGTDGGHRAITEQERTWIETLCTDHRAYPVVMTITKI